MTFTVYCLRVEPFSAVTSTVTVFWPLDRSNWWPEVLVSASGGVMAMVAPESLRVGVMVAWVTVLATPTSYGYRFDKNPMMSLGLTVRALRLASSLGARILNE